MDSLPADPGQTHSDAYADALVFIADAIRSGRITAVPAFPHITVTAPDAHAVAAFAAEFGVDVQRGARGTVRAILTVPPLAYHVHWDPPQAGDDSAKTRELAEVTA